MTTVVFFSHQLTPLHRAARRGRMDIVEYLIEKGAGIDIGDTEQVCTYIYICIYIVNQVSWLEWQ